MNSETVKELKALIDQIAELNSQVDELKSKRRNLEQSIIEDLTASGTTYQGTEYGTVTINKNDVPSVKDWAAFEEYIYEHKALYLLQRRPAVTAYREEVKTMGELPGVETFTKVGLSWSKGKAT
jgi:hypothetical protein